MTTIQPTSDTNLERHGYHTVWCSDSDDLHDDRSPYCERLIGGTDGVTEPRWAPTQLWVSTIHAFLHGTYTANEERAEEQHRVGVQLSILVHDGSEWVEKMINMRSGDARTLAALLVAAADINDGIAPGSRANR